MTFLLYTLNANKYRYVYNITVPQTPQIYFIFEMRISTTNVCSCHSQNAVYLECLLFLGLSSFSSSSNVYTFIISFYFVLSLYLFLFLSLCVCISVSYYSYWKIGIGCRVARQIMKNKHTVTIWYVEGVYRGDNRWKFEHNVYCLLHFYTKH